MNERDSDRLSELGQALPEYALIIAPFRVVQQLARIDDQLRFLAAVARHLAPTGRFVFDVFNPRFDVLTSADGVEREDTPELRLPDGRTLRRGATPPSHLNPADNPGACETKLARRGAREAMRAHQWMSPIA